MINIQISQTSNRVEHKGDPVRVGVEVAASVAAIFNGYKSVDSTAAEIFRMTLVRMMMPESPMWHPGEGDIVSMIIPGDIHKKGGAPTD